MMVHVLDGKPHVHGDGGCGLIPTIVTEDLRGRPLSNSGILRHMTIMNLYQKQTGVK